MVTVNVLQLIGPGDLRQLYMSTFRNGKHTAHTKLINLVGVNGAELQGLGQRIDRPLGRFGERHLLVEVTGGETVPWQIQANAYFSPSGIDLSPTADMAVMAAVMADRWLEAEPTDDLCFCGESAEPGFVPLPNPLQAGIVAHREGKTLVCPTASAPIAALTGATVIGVETVYDLADVVCGQRPSPTPPATDFDTVPGDGVDMRWVQGQHTPRRALEIAVAGGHNLLMVGPPGEGKSLLAKVIPTIAPPMTVEEMVEVTSIHMQHGTVESGLMTQRPVRSVSPSATEAAVLGGGHADPYPGEASLAHHGVLFCDEILQFRPGVVEKLRAPLQDGEVVINRVNWKMRWPADFQLVAACNPCPCGYWGHPEVSCSCTPARRRAYASRLSGPVADRIPVRVWVHPLGEEKLQGAEGEPSAVVRERIMAARDRQQARGLLNDDIGPAEQARIEFSPQAQRVLEGKVGLSTRLFHNLRKVSRTIADLVGSELVEAEHVEEATGFLEVNLPRE